MKKNWISESPSAGWKEFPVGMDVLFPWERALWSKRLDPACWGKQHTGAKQLQEEKRKKVTYKK